MKKKLIPIIIVVAVILVGVGVYLFYALNPARQQGLQNTLQNVFPFGQQQGGEPVAGGTITSEPGGGVTGGGSIETGAPALRQISMIPVNGYRALTTEELRSLPRTTTGVNGETTTVTELRPVKKYTVRFGSIENGAVYESTIDSAISTTQLTGAGIPAVDHVLFNINGDLFTSQYADGAFADETISTYVSHINTIPLIIEPCPFAFPVNLKFQDTSDAVANVQRFLNGYLGITISQTGENSPGNETGIFDELTREAVKSFQSSHNLTADGSVGPKTRAAFDAACMVIQTQKAQELHQQNNQFLYKIDGSFATDNILDIKNIDTNSLFYLIQNGSKTFGFIWNSTSGASQQVFDSPFSEWITQPLSQQKIIFTTKASGEVPGYAYELNVANKTFGRILGDITGLTTLANGSGSKILFGATTPGGYRLSLLDRTTGSTQNLAIETFPEKCVWANDGVVLYCAVPDALPNNMYPDALYQGLISTSDTLWSINTTTGTTQKLYDPAGIVNGGLTLSDLQVTNDGRYLFMKNLQDTTLWVLSLFE